MQLKHLGPLHGTLQRKTLKYPRVEKMRVKGKQNTLKPLWWSVKVKNWTGMLLVVKLSLSTCCKQAVVSLIYKESKYLLPGEKKMTFFVLLIYFTVLNFAVRDFEYRFLLQHHVYNVTWCAASSFVKAGKLFSTVYSLALCHSCYTVIQMWIFLQMVIFYEYCSSLPSVSLLFTYLANTNPLDLYLSSNADVISLNYRCSVICTANITGPESSRFLFGRNANQLHW